MKIREDFLMQLSLYLKGESSLQEFREWHIAEILDRRQYDAEDQEFLITVDAHFSTLMAGTPEDSFKKSLRDLLSLNVPARSPFIFVIPLNLTEMPRGKMTQVSEFYASGAYIPAKKRAIA